MKHLNLSWGLWKHSQLIIENFRWFPSSPLCACGGDVVTIQTSQKWCPCNLPRLSTIAQNKRRLMKTNTGKRNNPLALHPILWLHSFPAWPVDVSTAMKVRQRHFQIPGPLLTAMKTQDGSLYAEPQFARL